MQPNRHDEKTTRNNKWCIFIFALESTDGERTLEQKKQTDTERETAQEKQAEKEIVQDQTDITKEEEDTEREITPEQGDTMAGVRAEIETLGKQYPRTRETLKE